MADFIGTHIVAISIICSLVYALIGVGALMEVKELIMDIKNMNLRKLAALFTFLLWPLVPVLTIIAYIAFSLWEIYVEIMDMFHDDD